MNSDLQSEARLSQGKREDGTKEGAAEAQDATPLSPFIDNCLLHVPAGEREARKSGLLQISGIGRCACINCCTLLALAREKG